MYVFSKYSGVVKAEVGLRAYSGFYIVDNQEAHFQDQFTLDILSGDIKPWDYGALVFQDFGKYNYDDPKAEYWVIGQIIGKTGDEKSSKVMCTPFDRVLKAVNKKIFYY